jgi:hypothetical protein
MRSNCLTCGKPLLESPPRGRLPDYCGIVCRRKREDVLRRLRSRLRDFEKRLLSYSRPENTYGQHQMQYLLPALESARLALAQELGR